jgi:uncharacterized protein
MGSSLFVAFALVLVLEGLLPFLAPAAWREIFRKATALSDGQIRFFGLTSIAAGMIFLVFATPGVPTP